MQGAMDISTLKHMSRAKTHTYPVDRDMVERVVDQLQNEVSLLHEEAWQRTAEECQRDLSLVDFAFDQITGASETASALWAKLTRQPKSPSCRRPGTWYAFPHPN